MSGCTNYNYNYTIYEYSLWQEKEKYLHHNECSIIFILMGKTILILSTTL